MRIVVDMQGVQSPNTPAAMARNALLLTQAIVRNRGEHEVILALKAFQSDGIDVIRTAFSGMLPQENIRVWYAAGPVCACDPANSLRRDIAHRLRSAFLLDLQPDVVLMTGFFDGFLDNAVTLADEFAARIPTVVLLPRNAVDAARHGAAHEAFLRAHYDAVTHVHGWIRFAEPRPDQPDQVPVLQRIESVRVRGDRLVAKPVAAAANAGAGDWDVNAQVALQHLLAQARPLPPSKDIVRSLVTRIAAIDQFGDDEAEMAVTAQSIAANHPTARRRCVYVDATDVVLNDRKTGIQRVTRSVLSAMLQDPPEGYEIVPVYCRQGSPGFLRAESYLRRQLGGQADEEAQDVLIDAQPGDVFLALDFVHWAVVSQRASLEWMRNHGVRVFFVVYDLLPVRFPHLFPPGSAEGHEEWLRIVAQFDGAICISQTVQQDLDHWVTVNGAMRHGRFKSGWFHLGADVENSHPTLGLPDDAPATLDRVAAAPTFLMVGTVEPRKGHRHVLDAFELLWAQGMDLNLVIIGARGWMMDEFAARVQEHPRLNQQLFWPSSASDEYLGRIYAASSCLIAASECEGFGLPLIEAARHKLPIIARDIRVFREVAGQHAYYYSSAEPADLAASILEWLQLQRENRQPSSEGISWLTWEQSARQLLQNIC